MTTGKPSRSTTVLAPNTNPTVEAAVKTRTTNDVKKAQQKKKRRKLGKGHSKLMQRGKARKRRARFAALKEAASPPRPLGCEHPKARAYGVCQQAAVGEMLAGEFVPTVFDIPPDYEPNLRHNGQTPLPARARLCVQHKFIVEMWKRGADDLPPDFWHKSQCPVCCHPKADWVISLWLKWTLSGNQAAMELGVSKSSFAHHIAYYRLDEKKGEKVETRKALIEIAEQGLQSGKFTAKDAIAALTQLSKERGDVTNVNMRVASVDLTTMTEADLAKKARELAAQLEQVAQQGNST